MPISTHLIRGGLGVLACAAVLSMAGCEPKKGAVSGKVYYNENLVKGGMVIFYAADGRGFPTTIREDGSYSLESLPLGTMKVCVDTSSLNPKMRKSYDYTPPAGAKKDLPGASESAAKGEYTFIPPSYSKPETTEASVEVTGGSQTFDIKLK